MGFNEFLSFSIKNILPILIRVGAAFSRDIIASRET